MDSDEDIIPDTPPFGVFAEWLDDEFAGDVAVVEEIFRHIDEGLFILLHRDNFEFVIDDQVGNRDHLG